MPEKLLKNSKFFSNLEEKEIKEIKEIMRPRKYNEGEIIFFEDEPGEGLFLVKSGKVKLTKMVESGDEQILTIIQPGNVFAEVVLFGNADYPATAVALEDSKLYLIRSKDMEKLIKDKPSIAVKLLDLMSKRLRRAQKLVRDMGLKDTTCRTASLLLYLAQEYGVKRSNGIRIDLKLTQQELANMIGTTRETISRVLNKFKEKDIIKTAHKKMIINDLEQLKDFI
ncbi:Crp/Fnr family transcriptional regulator [Halanaerobacter jeridensis]|uniref:CRP/FNR family transcriptional regulator n=1 Tax=Halanaerobacter jeridensis TaxID=706427 RepID=A0A938XQV4_9FIRM|nr:Crp/Fnr family transcriptional regulator [Halanaerobacter jeridensis]MBM7555901.1 CRP/FNR family transcriptional regulator [Halanaerobacter jeridensis]